MTGMRKKRKDYPTFSNGTEFTVWMEANCDRCIKAERPVIKHKMVVGYANKGRCRVNEEIIESMVTDGVSKRVNKIINSPICPFIKTEWPNRQRRNKEENYPKLFEDGI